MTKEEFITKALGCDQENQTARFWYSHKEFDPPIFGPDYDGQPVLGTTETKAEEGGQLSDSEDREEDKEADEGGSGNELLIALDQETCLSFRGYNRSNQYVQNELCGKKRYKRLSELFSPPTIKRYKLIELYTKEDEGVYEMEELDAFLGHNDFKILADGDVRQFSLAGNTKYF